LATFNSGYPIQQKGKTFAIPGNSLPRKGRRFAASRARRYQIGKSRRFFSGLTRSPRDHLWMNLRVENVSVQTALSTDRRLAWLSRAEPEVRIHLPPAKSLLRTWRTGRARPRRGRKCSDDTAARCSIGPPRNRCLSVAELKVRIHLPPADSLSLFRNGCISPVERCEWPIRRRRP
jgi:hypothetical protein